MNNREITDKKLCAAIDLGSNSFRLLVAETCGTTITPIHKDLQTVRLAEGLQPTCLLQKKAINRSLTALSKFAKTLAYFAPQKTRVCGTAALRIAKNSPEFIDQAEKIIGYPIEIVQGEEEASLSLSGVLSALSPDNNNPGMVVDVGGGSTEIIIPEQSKLTKTAPSPLSSVCAASFPVGAVSMTEQFLSDPSHEQEGLFKLSHYLENVFLAKDIEAKSVCSPFDSIQNNIGRESIIASGGTATSLAALDLNLSEYQVELVQNHCIAHESLEHILDKLLRLSITERNKIASLKNGRGDIIIAGIQIHKTILKLSGASQLIISDAGLLEGILLSL
jgi:exopolyphosphatase/guanosine-5'-triphosphate,3'-diphosphate pyrophosphatase